MNDDVPPTALKDFLNKNKQEMVNLQKFDDVKLAGYIEQLINLNKNKRVVNGTVFYVMSRLMFALNSCDDDNVDSRHVIMWMIIDLTELTLKLFDI
jgi:hypothetical protein